MPLTFACVALLALPLVASAQVQGTVEDASGQPMPNAAVVVWGSGQLLDEAVTDGVGRFVSDVPIAEVRRVSVHHLGYRTAIVHPSTQASDDLRVTLHPLPAPLPEVVVTVASDICDERDDPAARSLYEAMSSRYAPDTGRRGRIAYGYARFGNVMSDEMGGYQLADPNVLEAEWARSGSRDNPNLPPDLRPLEAKLREEGYARVVRPGSSAERWEDNWAYPELWRHDAYHFASSHLGEGHSFQLIDTDDRGTELVFCATDTSRPQLRGRLRIAPDTALAEVSYLIETPEPRENAGGLLLLTDVVDQAGGRHLVPARSVFWHHDGSDSRFPDLPRAYTQLQSVFTRWTICMGPGLQPGGG